MNEWCLPEWLTGCTVGLIDRLCECIVNLVLLPTLAPSTRRWLRDLQWQIMIGVKSDGVQTIVRHPIDFDPSIY